MKTLKGILEFIKAFFKFLTSSMTGRVAIWGTVIMAAIGKLIMTLMDVAFEADVAKEVRTELTKEAEASNTNTNTEKSE